LAAISPAVEEGERRPARAGAAQDERVVAGALELDGEVAGRERVADEAGEGRAGQDGVLGRGGDGGGGERAGDEDERVGRAERVGAGRALAVEQVGPQPDPADEGAQHGVVQPLGALRAGGEVDVQDPAAVAVHAPQRSPAAASSASACRPNSPGRSGAAISLIVAIPSSRRNAARSSP
jgi:hypothetical protein